MLNSHTGTSGLVGFAAQTLIATPKGPRRVQDLRAGDLIETLDCGEMPLLWVGHHHADPAGPLPVAIATGVLDNSRDLVLAPDHLVMIDGSDCELLFGEPELFIMARDLRGLPGVTEAKAVAGFHHLLLDGHQIILANGMPVESLHPGRITTEPMATDIREALKSMVLPWELARLTQLPATLPVLGSAEARVLRDLRLRGHSKPRAAWPDTARVA